VKAPIATLQEHATSQIGVDPLQMPGVNRQPVLVLLARRRNDAESQRWRSEFLYSRAASIYGGTAEIQRNIIARRLLDLGSDR